MTAGNDGEEASRGEVGDTLMNQLHIQFRLAHTLALQCKSIHRTGCRVQHILPAADSVLTCIHYTQVHFIGGRDYTARMTSTAGNIETLRRWTLEIKPVICWGIHHHYCICLINFIGNKSTSRPFGQKWKNNILRFYSGLATIIFLGRVQPLPGFLLT